MHTLQKTLNYFFVNPDLLTQAMTHRSYAVENNLADNERLEFLGDSLLGSIVSCYFFLNDPSCQEGVMTERKSNLVSTRALADIARKIHLGQHLLLGKGESRHGGRDRNSNLTNALEAVIAAIFLDGGFAATTQVVLRLFHDELNSLIGPVNHKGRLQEIAQRLYKKRPVYRLVAQEGSAHDKTFTVTVDIGSITGRGAGKNKRDAQQEAARNAMEKISSLKFQVAGENKSA